MFGEFARKTFAALALAAVTSAGAAAQTPAPPAAADVQQPDQAARAHDMQMDMSSGWQFVQAGTVYGLYNRQGGLRGGDGAHAPNWWMGMLTKSAGRHQFTATSMFSADRVTVGRSGYREIFQVGETLDGRPLIDRQHPHDLFMQLAATWRVALSEATSVTFAGGPAGEPALGPPAFMHRPSSAAIAFAALGHHTFDSTHISFGVATAAIDHGRWTVEGSLFNGREPDENRWDIDLGRMDSVAGRVSVRPTPEWEVQFSSGRLVEPEQIAHTTLVRTVASASWLRASQDQFSALTVGYGVNVTDEGNRHAALGEYGRQFRAGLFSSRLEFVEVETALLLGAGDAHVDESRKDTVGALTLGALREAGRWRGLESAVGMDLTVYAVPAVLRPAYGRFPVSLQLFLQIRPVAGMMGRMWNMRMGRPMSQGGMAMNHAM